MATKRIEEVDAGNDRLNNATQPTIWSALITHERVTISSPYQAMATQQRKAVPPTNPDLLGLPKEVCNMIWQLVLGPADAHNYWETTTKGGIKGTVPALLRTCRQIRDETEAIFWSRITVHYNQPLRFAFPFCELSKPAFKNLRSVRIIPSTGYYDLATNQERLETIKARLFTIEYRGKVEVYLDTTEAAYAGLAGYTSDPVELQRQAVATITKPRPFLDYELFANFDMFNYGDLLPDSTP